MLYNKNNRELLEELNQLVYGHKSAKKALITLVNRSKIRHRQKWGDMIHKDDLVRPGKCLLVGGSGTGKTHIVESLAEIVDFPLLIVDATKFIPTSARGGITSDELEKMIHKTALKYAQRKKQSSGGAYFSAEGVLDQMVVFVDEFDKISEHYEGTANSWNAHVQSNFLTLFETKNGLDGVSWIFAGAFSGIETETKVSKKNIGFNASHDDEEEIKEITAEDIVKYGMLPEIIGRISTICSLDVLTEDDFYNILINIALPAKMKELTYFGAVNSTLKEEELREIARKASESSQGVRYLFRQLDNYYADAEFYYEEYKYNNE